LKPPKGILEVKRPLRGGFGSETTKKLTAIYNGHSQTEAGVCSGVMVMPAALF
jgi:hypothetical protein